MKFKIVETFEVKKQKYIYKGPVYSNNGLVASEDTRETSARSVDEAVNNILGQYYRDFGYRPRIEKSRVKLVTATKQPTKQVASKKEEPKTEYADGSEQISML